MTETKEEMIKGMRTRVITIRVNKITETLESLLKLQKLLKTLNEGELEFLGLQDLLKTLNDFLAKGVVTKISDGDYKVSIRDSVIYGN